MSKSNGSRVKYPTKSEINNQINSIIEQSHLFEIEQSQTNYVQCKRVKKSFFSSDAATVAIALAACVVIVLCVAPLIMKGTRSSTALSNPNNKETTAYEGNNITNGTMPAGNELSVQAKIGKPTVMDDGSLFKVYMAYCPVNVWVNNENATYIDDYYTDIQIKAWNNIHTKYVLPQTSSDKSDIMSVYVSNDLNSYNSNSKAGVININMVYTVSTQYNEDESGNSARVDYEYMQVDTFDIMNQKKLTYGDILKDYESGLEVMAKHIYEQIQTHINAGLTGIQEQYKTEEGIKEALRNSSSWQLGLNGITVYCNGYKATEQSSYNTERQVVTYGSFVLEYDKFDIIKENYR